MFWCLRKRATFIFNQKKMKDGCLKTNRFQPLQVLVDSVDQDLLHLLTLLWDSHVRFWVNISSHLQNAWVLTCWNELREKLINSLVVKRIFIQQQRGWEDKLWGNSWVVVARKSLQAAFQQSWNKPAGREVTFLTNTSQQSFQIFFVIKVFCNFWKSNNENPSRWRCLVWPETISLSY